MKQSSNRTEQEILEVAEKLFMEKGFARTSTIEIAKEAGCNQALVHYYFRSKENLFQKIFNQKVILTFSKFVEPLSEDKDFLTKVRDIVDAYFDFLSANEKLSYFLVSSAISNEALQKSLVGLFNSDPSIFHIFVSFDRSVQQEVAKGTIRKIDTFNLMMDIVCLCLSTFIALPLFKGVETEDPIPADTYLELRRKEIAEVIVSGIKV